MFNVGTALIEILLRCRIKLVLYHLKLIKFSWISHMMKQTKHVFNVVKNILPLILADCVSQIILSLLLFFVKFGFLSFFVFSKNANKEIWIFFWDCSSNFFKVYLQNSEKKSADFCKFLLLGKIVVLGYFGDFSVNDFENNWKLTIIPQNKKTEKDMPQHHHQQIFADFLVKFMYVEMANSH